MILSTVSSFSGVSNKEMASEMTKRHWSINLNQETASSSDDVVPDGTFTHLLLANIEFNLNVILDLCRSNCCDSRCTSAYILYS